MSSELPPPPTDALNELAKGSEKSRTYHVLLMFASLGMALGVIGAAVALGSRQEAVSRSNENRQIAVVADKNATAASGDAAAARSVAEEANRRLRAAGEPTVPVPSPSATVPVAPSEGLTAAEVRIIVEAAIRAYRPALSTAQVEQIAKVTAPKVVRPKDGHTPTAAELQPLIAVGVSTYCTEDRCVGKSGRDGIDGKDAPPITDEHLSELIDLGLTSYCSKQPGGTCKGVAGEPGTNGTNGTNGVDGRSIEDTDCLPDGTWRISYSEGPPVIKPGPCQGKECPTGTESRKYQVMTDEGPKLAAICEIT